MIAQFDAHSSTLPMDLLDGDSRVKISYPRVHSLPIGSLVLILLVGFGCASSPPGSDQAGPVQIRGIDVRPAAPGAVLEVLADGPLSWTAISDLDGSLILDLDDSVILPGLDDLALESGLVASVTIEAVEGFRPGTRLTVKTRERIDFSPNILGSSFQMRLLPQGRRHQGALAVEPLMVDEFGHSVESSTEVSELAASDVFVGDEGGVEDGEGPAVSAMVAPPRSEPSDESIGQESEEERSSLVQGAEMESPAGVARASRLLNVRVETSGTILIEADGEPLYQTFWLESPLRFVIDLPDVSMGGPAVDLPGGQPPLQRIRVGQFMSEPEAVARVVLDLSGPVRPEIEVTSAGLRVELHEVGTTEVEE